MPNDSTFKLASGTSVFKYQKLTRLCRRLWRNVHMSGYGSPEFYRSSVRRKIRNSDRYQDSSLQHLLHFDNSTGTYNLFNESTLENSNVIKDIANSESQGGGEDGGKISDDMDYINYDSCDSSEREVSPRNVQSRRKILNRNVEARRPLRTEQKYGETTLQKDHIKTLSHCCSPRHKTTPSKSPKKNVLNGSENVENCKTESDEDVEFIKEIKPKKLAESSRTVVMVDPSRRIITEAPSTSSLSPSKTRNVSTNSEGMNIRPLPSNDNHSGINKKASKRLLITLRLNNESAPSERETPNHGHCEKNGDKVMTPTKKFLSCPSRKSNSSKETAAVEETDFVDSQDDDDLIVVQTDDDNDEDIDHATLKRIVISVVSHYAEENDEEDVTPQYVLNRLKALYHKDFSRRLPEIKLYIRRALERCQSLEMPKLLRQIRPGIRLADIDTLSSENWLNDIIIDQYMAILVKDHSEFGAISSFWYEELMRGKEPSLPHNWQKLKRILVPTCVASHWILLCYSLRSNNVAMYSSMPVCKAEVQYGKMLLEFINGKLGVRANNGQCLEASGLPRQENEHDCGVYVCMFARCIVCGNSYDIIPQQVYEFRKWLKNEIVKGRLFGAVEEIDEEI